MFARPRIRMELSSADRLVEGIAICLLIFLWVIGFFAYRTLPATIPTHFDLRGQPDGFGNKLSILVLPGVGTLLFLTLTIINRFPHIFNYPVSITEGNAPKQYLLATRFIRYIKTMLLLLFNLLLGYTYATAKGIHISMGKWIVPVTLACTLLPTLLFVIRSLSLSKKAS